MSDEAISGQHRVVARDLWLVALLALVINCIGIASKSVWLDESVSAEFAARLGLRDIASGALLQDPNANLYYLLLNLWRRVFGISELAIRLPSALFVSATVPFLMVIGTRLFSRQVGVLAGVMLAMNSFVVTYGQTARSYALLLFLTTVATWLFVREVERPSRWTRIAYVVVGTLAFYAHFFGALTLLAHVVALVAFKRRGALTRENMTVAAALVVLCAPILFVVVRLGAGAQQWIPRPTLGIVALAFADFAGMSPQPAVDPETRRLWPIVGLVILAGAALWSVVRSAGYVRSRWPSLLTVSCVFVPVGAALVLSTITPIFRAFYLIGCVPPFMLLAANGLMACRPRALQQVAFGALVLLSIDSLRRYYQWGGLEDWRSAAAFVMARSQPGDGVMFDPFYGRSPFEYYADRSGRPAVVNLFEKPIGARSRVWWVTRRNGGATIDSVAIGAARVALRNDYRLLDSATFVHVSAKLYVRNVPTPSAPAPTPPPATSRPPHAP